MIEIRVLPNFVFDHQRFQFQRQIELLLRVKSVPHTRSARICVYAANRVHLPRRTFKNDDLLPSIRSL